MVSSDFLPPSPTPPPLSLGNPLTPAQLTGMNVHLDQLLLALYALTGLDDVTWRRALQRGAPSESPGMARAVGSWAHPPGLRGQSSPPLDLDSIRVLVEAISYLAQQYQELLRRSVTLIEQTTAQAKNPFQTVLLGEYGEKLRQLERGYRVKQAQSVPVLTDERALSLLMELLFYSSHRGARRLWGVLLVTAQTLVYEASSG